MAYKPRWIETESGFSSTEDNMIFVGPNGKLQDTDKLTFNADDGNGSISFGGIGNSIKGLSAYADDTLSFTVTDLFTYVNTITMDGSELLIQIADSPGNISQSYLDMNRTGTLTLGTQDDSSFNVEMIIDSGVVEQSFKFDINTDNTELKIDDNGITLASGPAVNEISNDSGTDSTSVLLTSSAIQEAISSTRENDVDLYQNTRLFSTGTLKNYNKIEGLDIEKVSGLLTLATTGNVQNNTTIGGYFFGDGRVLYIYRSSSSAISYQIRTFDGTSIVSTTILNSSSAIGVNSVSLPNGNIAILVFEATASRNLVLYEIDSSGNLVLGRTLLKSFGTTAISQPGLKLLPNGELFCAYIEEGGTQTTSNIYYIKFNQNGVITKDSTAFTTDNDINKLYYQHNVSVARNGNIAIVWRPDSSVNRYIKIIDQNDNIIINKTLIANDGATAQSDVWLKISAFNSGNWIFVYHNSSSTSRVSYIILDPQGNEIADGTFPDESGSGTRRKFNIAILPEDIAIVGYIDWTTFVTGPSGSPPTFRLARVDQLGNQLDVENAFGDNTGPSNKLNLNGVGPNGQLILTTNFRYLNGSNTAGAYAQIWRGTGTRIRGNLRVDTLITDASSVIIGTTELSEKSGGGLLVNGEEVGGGGVTDHGALTGLDDDDHTQYFRTDGTRVMTGPIQFQNGGSADEVSTDSASDSTSVLLTSSAVQEAISSNLVFTEDSDNNIIGGTGAGSSIVGGSGTNNFLAGSNAGFSITTGDNNIIIGDTAGNSLTTASGCIIIGFEAGLNETNSNKLHIANNQNESLIEGDFSARTAHVNGTFTAEKVEAFGGSVVSTDSTAITNQVVLVNATSGAATVDLIYEENAYIVVKKTDSSVNAVTIQGADGKTIDGSATQSLTTQYQAYTLFGFNDEWHII